VPAPGKQFSPAAKIFRLGASGNPATAGTGLSNFARQEDAAEVCSTLVESLGLSRGGHGQDMLSGCITWKLQLLVGVPSCWQIHTPERECGVQFPSFPRRSSWAPPANPGFADFCDIFQKWRNSVLTPQRTEAGGAMSGIMKPEWPGAASKWHIQAHNRNDAGPSGPPHWPKRPFDVGGFCASVPDLPPRGQRHFDAPPSGIV
jgi:hypothetical protein